MSRLRRKLSGRFLLLAIGLVLVASAAARHRGRFITVYFKSSQVLPAAEIEVRSAAEIRVLSCRPVAKSRPLLLIVDPTGFTGSEIRRLLKALAESLAQAPELWDSGTEVRAGLPILDGILLEPIRQKSDISRALLGISSSYITESFLAADNSLGRTLDLIGSLVQRTEGSAALDCLILAKDRSFSEDDSAYLRSGMERRFLEIAAAHGSTFYGYIQGEGLIGDLCRSTGGSIIPLEHPASEILQEIIDGRSRGHLLEISETAGASPAGRFPLSILTRTSGHLSQGRGPAALWEHPDGVAAPDYIKMREALDCRHRADQAEQDASPTLALRWLDAGLASDPWNPALYHQAARIAAAMNDLGLSLRYLAAAIRFAGCPEDTVVLYCQLMRRSGQQAEGLAGLEAMLVRGREETAAIQLEHARLLSAAGRMQEAKSDYLAAIQRGPDRDQVRAELGRLLERLGDDGGADQQLSTALQYNPDNVTALIGRSQLALKRKRLEEARALARRAIEIDAHNADAEDQAGKVCLEATDWQCAGQHFLNAFNLAPSRREFAYDLADSRFKSGRVAEATDLLRQLLIDRPADGETRTRLAGLLVRAGLLTEAAGTLESGTAQEKEGLAEFYLAAAHLREKRSDYGQAVLDYRAALASADASARLSREPALKQHVLYLLMSLGGSQQLAELPVVKELGLEASFAPARRTDARLGTADPTQVKGLIVPGGLALLTRALDLPPPAPADSGVLESVFSSIVESDRRGGKKESSLSRRALSHLGSYDDLLRHLTKNRLIPVDFDGIRGQELVFPLVGNQNTLARTATFLRFFGAKLRLPKGGVGAVTLELQENARLASRRQLLRNMGVEITHLNQQEIRLRIQDQEVPLLFGRDFWNAAGQKRRSGKTHSLIERMLGSPGTMRLYLALASCSESVRNALGRAASHINLEEYLDVLSLFGRTLDIRSGRLALPGAEQPWEALLGVPSAETERFLLTLLGRDRGRALFLYSGLSAASQEVQRYFAASPERLRRLYDSLSPYSQIDFRQPAAAGQSKRQLCQIMRRFTVQGDDLRLAGTSFAMAHLLGRTTQDARPATDTVGIEELPGLFSRDFQRQSRSYSTGDILELLAFLNSEHPKWMTEKNVADFVTQPEEAAVLLNQIGDLQPSPEHLQEYFEYCRQLARDGMKERNADRIRTCAALFHLISLLRREGAIATAEADVLFTDALTRLRTAPEGEFAQTAARFLSSRLLRTLGQSSEQPLTADELLLRGLAGGQPVRELMFEGRKLYYDAAGLRLRNMKGAIQQQRYTSLSTLMEIYRLLEDIPSDGKKIPELRDAIVRMLGQVRPAQFPARTPKDLRRAAAGIDLEAVQAKWNESQQARHDAAALRTLSRQLAEELDSELGVTLLTYCYAYYGSPAIDALAFDVNFVRKHDFLGPGRSPLFVWRPAGLRQDAQTGSYIEGSVSGLGYELASLETASASMGLDEPDSALLPAMLAGLRAIRPSLLTERAQESAALISRLGRELLTLGALNQDLRRWSDETLARFVPPSRRESIRNALEHFETENLSRLLTPSEFFFLGEEYVRSEQAGEQVPVLNCPILDRIRDLAAEASRSHRAEFREEMSQFGVLLRSRLGLDVFSLASPESYEDLETNKRIRLFDRICDLRIRLADIQYSLGLPAFALEVDGELALRDVLPRSEKVQAHSWRLVLDRIRRLSIEKDRSWIEEAINRGWLVPAGAAGADGEGAPQ